MDVNYTYVPVLYVIYGKTKYPHQPNAHVQINLTKTNPPTPASSPMKFITSFNPNSRIEHQLYCLNSWRQYDLPILAVQHESERVCSDLFPEVEFVYIPSIPNPWNSLFPSISAMCEHFPGILINSDINLTFSTAEFTSYINASDPVIGIRTESGKLNQFGIDMFISSKPYTPPANDFLIGKPGWDYFLVLEWYFAGIFHTLHHGLIHAPHNDRWCANSLRIAQDLLSSRYSRTSRQVTDLVQKVTGRA